MVRVPAIGLVVAALLLAGCGDDGDADATGATGATVTLGDPLPVGASYEDPSGNVTLTVDGIRLTGGLLLADAAACASADGLPALPLFPTAWQLRLEDREQPLGSVTVDRPNAAARPPWPATAEVAAGECVEGKVAFRIPEDARPTELVFTQLNPPVSWRIRT